MVELVVELVVILSVFDVDVGVILVVFDLVDVLVFKVDDGNE